MPGGLDQEKQDQMQKVVTDVSGLFVKNFAIAFAIEIAIAAKEEMNPPTDWMSDLKLLPPSADKTPSKDLMEGKVTKRGGKITNWKERYMVLHGDDDNYKLEYFDGKPEAGKKPKGSIELAGYRVRQVPEEGLNLSKSALYEQVFIRAQLKEGQYGLKLDPWSYGRRVYYFIFDSVEEGKKWKKALDDGCWYARNPQDENPVVAKAFNRCLNMVRATQGVTLPCRCRCRLTSRRRCATSTSTGSASHTTAMKLPDSVNLCALQYTTACSETLSTSCPTLGGKPLKAPSSA